MYTRLFTLCGFEQEEIQQQRARIDKAFERLEISPDDISRAEERVSRLFDVELRGMRLILGIWMKEFLDLVLAKDEGRRVIYGDFPPIRAVMICLANAREDVWVGIPEMVIDIVMGSFFDKSIPVLEAGEDSGLPAGAAHCSLLQARLGALAKGWVPPPDLILSSGYLCDQAPKVDELIHKVYGSPVAYTDSFWGQNWGDYPALKDERVEYFAARIDQSLQQAEEIIGCHITEEMKNQANADNGKVWFGLQALSDYSGKCDPQPLSQADQAMVLELAFGSARRASESTKAINTLTREVGQRAREGKGVVEKGAPRVSWYGPSIVDPELLRMVEGLGLAVCVVNVAWLSPLQRSKTKYTDFSRKVAEGYLREGPPYGSEGVIGHFKQLCEELKPDGIINCYPMGCRPCTIAPWMTRRVIQEEFGIPVLTFEYDGGNKRDYGVEQLRTRIEAFAEVLRAAKSE